MGHCDLDSLSNGRKVFFRYAKELDSAYDKRSKPDRIILEWTYQSETGQPVTEERQQINLIKDLFETILYGDHFATLARIHGQEFERMDLPREIRGRVC